MNYKIVAAAALLPVLVACGGGGDGTPVADIDRGNTGDRPVSGNFSSSTAPIVENGVNSFDDAGPQVVNIDRVVSWPGLRFGDFLLMNNPWNASLANYDGWNQSIELREEGGSVQAVIDWDWGGSTDTNGSVFSTKSYPEIIYGTKSAAEVSGDFAATGLPAMHMDMPTWTIDYDYWSQGRRSESTSSTESDSEYNIAIESFYHASCDIKRTGRSTPERDPVTNEILVPADNQVMEVMVWLKIGQRKPSGQPPLANPVTTSDGRVYDVYIKTESGNPNYVAYVAREEQTSGTVMYSELLNDAYDNASTYGIYQVKTTDCLANILFGTEIWHGAGTFVLNDFQINRAY